MPGKIDNTSLKTTIVSWLKVFALFLDDAAVLLLIILTLQIFNVQVPLPAVIILAILFVIIVVILHRTVIMDFRRKPVTGNEGMIGMEGRVAGSLHPKGMIIVEGEHWQAKSKDGDIEVDETVEIVGVDRLTLQVKRKK